MIQDTKVKWNPGV